MMGLIGAGNNPMVGMIVAVAVAIQDINLVWNKGIHLYVKAKNTDESGNTSSYLVHTGDSNKKIAYKIHLGSNVVYYATERAYDEEIGILTNTMNTRIHGQDIMKLLI